MAMPDGPEYLTTFLAVSQVAVCAPLNPAFRASEFEFFLSDIRARALIVRAGMDSAAILVAREMGVPVIEALADERRPAGTLSFTTPVTAHRQDGPCYAPDTALLLHTSATTGRPKLVPLTHEQLVAMVAVIRKAFPQADEGRVLIITPQFHLQCILSMLVQLFSGGASICTPGFRPECFLDWMRIFSPTQYTAGPTLHQAILSLCPSGEPHPSFRSLRFVTSGGALLTDALQGELERVLGVPVVDGYGLTEAGRVTMTPLDPARRKPGSAGICVGPEVAIIGENGGLLGIGVEGEIVLRGPMVMSGYAHDCEANRRAFQNGWLRTGDLGYMDDDGFLFVTGRLKEMINRGAEKILPYEIEAVLARHPAVQEVAVFGYPHSRLGEDVGAAVVLRQHMTASSTELRGLAAEYLADFKVPRRIAFVAGIPKGLTGKYQRGKLAESLGLSGAISGDDNFPDQEPHDSLETLLADIWANVLGVEKVGRGDDFFALGGDSLLAATMLAAVECACGCSLDPRVLVLCASFADFTATVREKQGKAGVHIDDGHAALGLVALQTAGDGLPLFLFPPFGSGAIFYRRLVDHLGDSRPVYAFEFAWRDGSGGLHMTLEAMIDRCITECRRLQPFGPYLLGGFSLGGMLVYEMARELKERGESIAGVILIDPDCVGRYPRAWISRILIQAESLVIDNYRRARNIIRVPIWRWPGYVRGRLVLLSVLQQLQRFLRAVFAHYQPVPVSAPALLLCCLGDGRVRRKHLKLAWSSIIIGGLTIRDIPGEHGRSLFKDPCVKYVADEMLRYMP
jgi:acyl-CoA synthetase (AMP-forming)/AMP-acid ligase II/surfactin synthase thioesterase subunit